MILLLNITALHPTLWNGQYSCFSLLLVSHKKCRMNLIGPWHLGAFLRDQSDSSYMSYVRQVARTNKDIEFVGRILLDLKDENSWISCAIWNPALVIAWFTALKFIKFTLGSSGSILNMPSNLAILAQSGNSWTVLDCCKINSSYVGLVRLYISALQLVLFTSAFTIYMPYLTSLF